MMLRGETVGIFHYGLIVDGPLTLLCFTGAYACRGLRLVVMYHPDMRARWGKHLKQHTVVKGMALLFVMMEILLWSATAAFGLTRYERGPHSISRSRRGERSLWLWTTGARKYSDFVPMHHHAQVKWNEIMGRRHFELRGNSDTYSDLPHLDATRLRCQRGRRVSRVSRPG